MQEKDLTEKTLEQYNDVFADIVNGLLFSGKQIVKEQSLTDAQPFSLYKADGRIREQDRDVAKYWLAENGKKINIRIALFGAENQTKYDPHMPLRVIGYDGAAYRAQIGQKELYPVITLVLYFGDRPWGKNRTLYDVVKVPEELKPYVKDYGINVFEISHLPEEAINNFHSDFRIVVDYFVHKRSNPDYRPRDAEKFRHTDELLKLMAVMTKDRRYEEVLYEEGGAPQNMCELLDRVEAKGREEGIREGIEKGIEKGADMARLESIRSVMEGLKYTSQQAMDLLKIPAADRQRYIEKL